MIAKLMQAIFNSLDKLAETGFGKAVFVDVVRECLKDVFEPLDSESETLFLPLVQQSLFALIAHGE